MTIKDIVQEESIKFIFEDGIYWEMCHLFK